MASLRTIGAGMVVLGGVLFVCALALLPWFERQFGFGFVEWTLWDLTTREPTIFTAVAATAILSAVASLRSAGTLMPALATGLSFYLLGRTFPTGVGSYSVFGTGFWVATAAAAVMSVGGILAVAGGSFASRFARPS